MKTACGEVLPDQVSLMVTFRLTAKLMTVPLDITTW